MLSDKTESMRERFEFFVRRRGRSEVRVVVRRRAVELVCPAKGFLYAGVWDDGGYVRYVYAHQVPVHPVILDEIDAELRTRMPRSSERDAAKRGFTSPRPGSISKSGAHRRQRGAILDLPPENLRRKDACR